METVESLNQKVADITSILGSVGEGIDLLLAKVADLTAHLGTGVSVSQSDLDGLGAGLQSVKDTLVADVAKEPAPA